MSFLVRCVVAQKVWRTLFLKHHSKVVLFTKNGSSQSWRQWKKSFKFWVVNLQASRLSKLSCPTSPYSSLTKGIFIEKKLYLKIPPCRILHTTSCSWLLSNSSDSRSFQISFCLPLHIVDYSITSHRGKVTQCQVRNQGARRSFIHLLNANNSTLLTHLIDGFFVVRDFCCFDYFLSGILPHNQ